jgi:hypothetical protein
MTQTNIVGEIIAKPRRVEIHTRPATPTRRYERHYVRAIMDGFSLRSPLLKTIDEARAFAVDAMRHGVIVPPAR